ncbi:hypothetical protein C2G38_2209890 [Gigaspora rosea]|uniref:Uncharacterized protein n=1 Tax=Gigaspora rosea TaxID=44941 RepID=A0A397UNU7_9GLOM|nr:hypothetical protein C2G38_2209890 [Gigaspora rosea]
MSNWPLTNELQQKSIINIFEQIIQVNELINSNETSIEKCLEEIISNVEFDAMDNSYNKLGRNIM